MDNEVSNELLSQVNDLTSKLEKANNLVNSLREERDSLQDDLDWANSDIDMYEERIAKYEEEFDPDRIKNDVMFEMKRRLNQDSMMSKELEEWLDDFIRFYLKSI